MTVERQLEVRPQELQLAEDLQFQDAADRSPSGV